MWLQYLYGTRTGTWNFFTGKLGVPAGGSSRYPRGGPQYIPIFTVVYIPIMASPPPTKRQKQQGEEQQGEAMLAGLQTGAVRGHEQHMHYLKTSHNYSYSIPSGNGLIIPDRLTAYLDSISTSTSYGQVSVCDECV